VVRVRDLVVSHFRDGWPLLLGQHNAKRPWGGLDVWDATRDRAQIGRWGIWWPEGWTLGNVMGRTGDGLVAFDVDPAEGGDETIAKLAAQGLALPPTRTHGTPSGGRHLICTAPEGTRGGKLGPGLTLRGFGSLVVLPGSVVDGKPYVVLDDRPPVELPGWVPEYLARHTPAGYLVDGTLAPEPIDVEVLPRHLYRFRLDAPELGRRSGQVYRFVANVLEYGYSAGQALTLGRDYAPAIAKYGPRLDIEVGRIVAKLAPLHQHPGRPCDVAGCPFTPAWMGGAR
jgi:hypothetical protein